MFEAKAERAFVELNWKADTRPLHQLIDEIRATNPAAMPKIVPFWLTCALAERDVAAAKEALLAAGEESPLGVDAIHFPRPFVEGLIARMTNDEHKAQLAFTAARDGTGQNRPGSTRLRSGIVRARCNRCRPRAEG